MSRSEIESLMHVPNIKPSRRKNRWPLSVTPPRTACCNKQPPACTCKGDADE